MIIGAPKSGTSSLAHWLGQRPDMTLCRPKEPRFFTDFADIAWTGPGSERFRRTLIADESIYLQAFGALGPEDWAVDASTDYLWCDRSPELLSAWAARRTVKVIAILRDPIDRAISEYQHSIRDEFQTCSLMESLRLEPERIRSHHHPIFYHMLRSRYSARVAVYRQAFGGDFLAIGYDALRDPEALVSRIEAFIGVGAAPTAPIAERNVSYVYRGGLARRLLRGKGLMRLARALVPRALRAPIRRAASQALTTRYALSADEHAALLDRLGDEIAACRDDPYIPTEGWGSLALLRGAAN